MIDNSNSPTRRWEAIKNRFDISKPIIGAEIGVWKGQMSKKLLEAIPTLHLTMVDWWQAPPDGHSYFDGSIKIARMSNEELEQAYKQTLANVYNYQDRINIIRKESAAASEMFPDKFFDFVFLDGDHSYRGMVQDLIHWVRKVKNGGWICGHDYGHPQQGDVKGAVADYFDEEILKNLELDGNRTWFLKL